MRIFFVRHAEAEEGRNDAVRALTPEGRNQAQAIGKFLAKTGVVFDAAFSSTLVRAKQTAEIILGLSNPKEKFVPETTRHLAFDVNTRAFDAWLQEQHRYANILLVGHNPSMTEQVARLLSMDDLQALRLSKGAMACLKWEPPAAPSLKLFISPKWLP